MVAVWIKDAKVGWVPSELTASADDEVTARDTIGTRGTRDPEKHASCSSRPVGGHIKHNAGATLPRAPHDESHEDDLTNLLYIHEASILHNLGARFGRSEPYTFISRVLIAVNPIEEVAEPTELAGRTEVLDKPHPFSVAENAFQQMERQHKSQCIVVSGESGSGKTETSKRVIRHLVVRTGDSCSVDEQLLGASPMLEAFGNAQTASNGNSSRFGKFVNLYFSQDAATFRYAAIETYLLERSRVIVADDGERSFHIFYQLLAGAPEDLRAGLFLQDYDGLLCAKVRVTSDAEDFRRLTKSMELFGMDAGMRKDVFAVVAAVLHLAGLRFVDKDSPEGNVAHLADATRAHLVATAALLCVPEDDLLRLICQRTMALRGETMVSRRNAAGAAQARDALAKALYQRLFDWLVVTINVGLGNPSIGPDDGGAATATETSSLAQEAEVPAVVTPAAPKSANELDPARDAEPAPTFIGILDIFGFECFEKNSFEQLLINFANEALQTTFNEQVFEAELGLYRDEGLDTSSIKSPPNTKCTDCLALFQTVQNGAKRQPGLLAALNTISVSPEPSDAKLIAFLHRSFRGRACFLDPHPRVAASTFIIEHYAGPVAYKVHGFVEKNADSLPPEADAFFLEQPASSRVLAAIFAASRSSKASSARPRAGSKTSKKSKSIAAKFEGQIRSLMQVIRATQCSFVRCIKPNASLDFGKGFDAPFVTRQLACLSIPQTAQLLQAGLPGRISYASLRRTFDPVLRARLPSHLQGDAAPRGLGMERIVVKCILRSLGADAEACKFGKSRVFFASGALASIDASLKAIAAGEAEIPEDLATEIEVACSVVAARRLLIVCGALRRRSRHLERRKELRARVVGWLQRQARRRRAQRDYLRARRAILAIQRAWRARRIRRDRNAKATLLQAFVRGVVAQRKYLRLRSAVRCLQLAWQLKSDLFNYSASDNDSVSTASGLAAAWDARLHLESDLVDGDGDGLRSRLRTLPPQPERQENEREQDQEHRSGVDALIDDILRRDLGREAGVDVFGAIDEAIRESDGSVAGGEAETKAGENDARFNHEVGTLPSNSVEAGCYESTTGRVAVAKPLGLAEALTARSAAANATRITYPDVGTDENEDVGYHADDDGRILGDHDDDEGEEGPDASSEAVGNREAGAQGDQLSSLGVQGRPAKRLHSRQHPRQRQPRGRKVENPRRAPRRNVGRAEKTSPSGSMVPGQDSSVHGDPAASAPTAGQQGQARAAPEAPEEAAQCDDGVAVHEQQEEDPDEDSDDAEDDSRGSVELLRHGDDAHSRRHSNEELTSMLLRLSPLQGGAGGGGGGGGRNSVSYAPVSRETSASAAAKRRRSFSLSASSRSLKDQIHGLHAQEGTFAQVVDDYARNDANQSFSSKSGKSFSQSRNRKALRKFKISGMFTLRKREERLVLRKLKTGMRKKHYRQVIEALVRARELELTAPEVMAAEHMIYRVKTLHAQQILREALVLRDVEPLTHAIDQAIRFGMAKDDPQGLLRDAKEMLAKLKRRSEPRRARSKSSAKAPARASTGAAGINAGASSTCGA